MTARSFVPLLFGLALGACKSSPTGTPAPAPVSTAVVAVSSSAEFDLTGADHEAAHREECPPADAEDREHCVWLKPVPGIPTVELKRRLKAAGFEAEAETDKVYAYWKPSTIQSFFGVKPGYVKTGGSGGGTICMMVLPKGARPATKGVIAGWAIDDPVCEM